YVTILILVLIPHRFKFFPYTTLFRSPSDFHYFLAKEALEQGKNVLVEKPFTNTSEEAKELFALAKEKDLFIQAYQNRRFDSDFRSEEHTSELQSRFDFVCRLLLEKKI